MSQKQTRARAPKPPTSFSGMTADMWRADASHLEWAQRTPIFGEIGAVLTNSRSIALVLDKTSISEGRLLGRAEGYQMALEIFFSLAQGIPKPAARVDETYQTDDPKHTEPTD